MANMSFRSLFIGIFRTWLLLLVGLSLTLGDQPTRNDGVIVQKIGKGYLYIFPPVEGRIVTKVNPAGVINVGSTITVMYSLRLIGHAKTRFIGMDATRTSGISPNLTVMKAPSSFGFFVRDTNQSVLQISIDPSFMKKIADMTEKQVRGVVASEGNLNVTFYERAKVIVIKEVRLE